MSSAHSGTELLRPLWRVRTEIRCKWEAHGKIRVLICVMLLGESYHETKQVGDGEHGDQWQMRGKKETGSMKLKAFERTAAKRRVAIPAARRLDASVETTLTMRSMSTLSSSAFLPGSASSPSESLVVRTGGWLVGGRGGP